MTDERTLTALLAAPGGETTESGLLIVAGTAQKPAPPEGNRLHLVGAGLEIGRRPEPDDGTKPLRLDDPSLSARHARIVTERDAFVLHDLGSKNGTFVGDVRVLAPHRLDDGDVVFLGGAVLVFRLVSGADLAALASELAHPLGPVGTANPTLARALDRLRRLAPSEMELLLVGETGVGKEVYARAVHGLSGRQGRFVPINCAALPRDLVESELFGYRQGAHSTAQRNKPGLIEEAEGGTLFLDEIGEMPSEAQAKLLRFLQDRELTPLGSTRPRKLDVRVIAATSRDPADNAAGAPAMRDDLVGRLGGSPVRLPPLRDRIEDAGALISHFTGAPASPWDAAAFRAVFNYAWPLNVRELEKAVTTALALTGRARPVGLCDLPEAASQPEATARGSRPAARGPAEEPDDAGRSPTAEELDVLLRRTQGNVAEVARALGKHRAAIWRWMKKFGLDAGKYRG